MRILVVNPNTTAGMTEKIAAGARLAAAASTEIAAVTSSMDPASIEGYYNEALAVPGLLIGRGEREGAAAAVIACFDDTGLDPARAMVGVPVIDGVGAAVKQAEALLALGLTTSKRGAYAFPMPKTYSGALECFAPKRAMA